MDFAASFQLSAAETILGFSGVALMIVAAWGGDRSAKLIGILSIAALVAATFVAGTAFSGVHGNAFGGLYRMDAFGSFAKILIFVSAAIAIMLAPRFFNREETHKPEYPLLILFAACGMGMMVSAADMLTLYIGLELNSLASYVLASIYRKDQRSAEAGLKYFVLGSLASGILLYGISLLYGFTGTTSFDGIALALKGGVNMGQQFGIVFVLAGLAFKISAVPFHMWTPDVYEGAPTPVTAFFATAPKVAAIALTVRVAITAMGPATGQWQQIIIFTALASIIFGAAAAIGQNNIKRLLAYSSINNVGFALVGLAAGTQEGVAAIMSYMAIYVIMTLGSFACVTLMEDSDGNPVESIASLSGLSQVRPGLAAAFAILMFSLAGIPPLFGFWAKFLVFDAAVAAGLLPLAAIGIAASVIGAFYYLKIIKTIYFDETMPGFAKRGSGLENGVIAICATAILVGYAAIPFLSSTANAAAKALF
jgi:NADH-quinone oxidoreductase subunit N